MSEIFYSNQCCVLWDINELQCQEKTNIIRISAVTCVKYSLRCRTLEWFKVYSVMCRINEYKCGLGIKKNSESLISFYWKFNLITYARSSLTRLLSRIWLTMIQYHLIEIRYVLKYLVNSGPWYVLSMHWNERTHSLD